MDPALYYRIYEERMDKWVILKYAEYIKTCYLHNLVKNYVWRTQPKAES